MKANVRFQYRNDPKAQRMYMVWLQQLLTCWTLHTHFGFGKQRLLKYLEHNSQDSIEIGQMQYGYAANRTWSDELWAWGESMGLNETLKGMKQ